MCIDKDFPAFITYSTTVGFSYRDKINMKVKDGSSGGFKAEANYPDLFFS